MNISRTVSLGFNFTGSYKNMSVSINTVKSVSMNTKVFKITYKNQFSWR